MARRHPPADLIASYATGELPAAPGLTVAAHAETCVECDASLRRAEHECGRLLDSLPDANLEPNALDRILARIAHAPRTPDPRPETAWLEGVQLPAALARFGLAPRRWLKPGVWIAHVRAPRADGWRAYLVRAEANVTLPPHAHRGREFISVLRGAFFDGQTYVAGDFAQNEVGSEHRQQVTGEGPCISLVAAQAPARWRGAARFIAPLFAV